MVQYVEPPAGIFRGIAPLHQVQSPADRLLDCSASGGEPLEVSSDGRLSQSQFAHQVSVRAVRMQRDGRYMREYGAH